MRDPREKRPTIQDLLDQRHQTWLKSLRNQTYSGDTRIIQLNPYIGKTAKNLTEREIEVLQMVSFGASTRQIAKKLFLSSHTITNHRKNMLQRSGCGNLSELIRVAINENLL